MKALLYLTLAGALCSSAQANTSYSQLIWQTEYDADGNELYSKSVSVSRFGKSESIDYVQFQSDFLLQCIKSSNGTSETTDIGDVTVNAYAPQASLTLSSEDPFVGSDGMRRTRVDRLYSLTYTVDKLLTNDPTAPEAAKAVQIKQSLNLLQPDSLEIDTSVATSSSNESITKNGTETESKPDKEPTADPFVISPGRNGLATYSISTLKDGDIDSYLLGNEARMLLVPEAEGSISGVDPEEEYKVVPDLTLSITSAYPGSRTYLVVTHIETNDTFEINLGEWENTFEYGKDNEWVVNGAELDQLEAFDYIGKVRVELLSDTKHFGIDPEAEVCLNLAENVISVKGMITAAE